MLWWEHGMGKVWNQCRMVDRYMVNATLIVGYIPMDSAKGFNGKSICDAFCDNFLFWASQICEMIHIGIHAVWGMVVYPDDESIRIEGRHDA